MSLWGRDNAYVSSDGILHDLKLRSNMNKLSDVIGIKQDKLHDIRYTGTKSVHSKSTLSHSFYFILHESENFLHLELKGTEFLLQKKSGPSKDLNPGPSIQSLTFDPMRLAGSCKVHVFHRKKQT